MATTWTAFLLAALRALPALISLIANIKAQADAATNQGIGYDQAVAETLKRGAAMLAIARDVEGEADKDHAAHPNDDRGFDAEFRRD